MSGSVELETSCVSPGGGVDAWPTAVPPSVPVPPLCSVSGRDRTNTPMRPFYTVRVGEMKSPSLVSKAASLQVHAAEEVLEAWVGARRVQDGVHIHT